jgi:hypothetical protein
MATAVVNLSDPIERGDTLFWEFNWMDDQIVPEPVDMRGKELVLTIKISPFIADVEAPVLVSYTPAVADAVAQAGTVVMTVPKSQTINLIAGATHHYALRVITDNGDTEVTHVKGTVPVEDA